MTIAVDFDGVIHRYGKGWNGGEIYDKPVNGVREALQKLRNEGHKIYIFSVRTNTIFHKKDKMDQEKMMKAWLEENQIPYDKIWTFGKPMADIFIDDRAIGFKGNWDETLNDVLQFKSWIDE